MRDGVYDDLINLLHSSRVTDPVREFLPVRNLVYSTHNELLSLLQAGPTSSSIHVTADGQPEDEPGLEQDDDLEPEIDTGIPQPVPDYETHSQDLTEIPEELMPIYDDQEIQAAYIIQAAFRSFLWRSRNVIDDKRQPDKAHEWFARYKDTLQPDLGSLASGSLGSVRYSIFYLGPLPKLLTALEAIWDLLAKKKRGLKHRLNQILGNEQGEVNAAITGIK